MGQKDGATKACGPTLALVTRTISIAVTASNILMENVEEAATAGFCSSGLSFAD